MEVNFSDVHHILNNGQKLYSFDAHFVQHFKYTMSCTYLYKCMAFKLVKQINLIVAMIPFTKPNCNIYMYECLMILKKVRAKRVTTMTSDFKI